MKVAITLIGSIIVLSVKVEEFGDLKMVKFNTINVFLLKVRIAWLLIIFTLNKITVLFVSQVIPNWIMENVLSSKSINVKIIKISKIYPNLITPQKLINLGTFKAVKLVKVVK